MKGSKQCPQCECTDVPVNAEVCPFCGYEFVKPTVAEPKVKQKKPVVRPAEEKKPSEATGISEGEKEGAVQETGSQSIVTEGTAIPESTEYTTYQKKGLRKKAVSGTVPQMQGGNAAVSWLAAALAVAVLFVAYQFFYPNVYMHARMEFLVWLRIVEGAMLGFLHVCCYANEKGSRRAAGILGIILGAGSLMLLSFLRLRERTDMAFLPYATLYFSNHYSVFRSVLVLIAVYAICWLTAAKLAKNRKSKVMFCVTAAELFLLPCLADWITYHSLFYRQLAVSCVAMLVTDFLLYRIRPWLAVKTRWLFWIIYFIVIVAALVSMYGSRFSSIFG